MLVMTACQTAAPGTFTPTAAQPSLERLESPPVTFGGLPEPFVRLVDLTRLHIGMTRAEVLAVFPDPVQIKIPSRAREVWNYSFAQLLFKNGRLEDWFNLRP